MFFRQALFGFTLCLSLVTGQAQARDKLVFSTFEKNPLVGACGAVLREVYKRIGIEIEILSLPGRRAIRNANEGKTDGEVFRIGAIGNKYENLRIIPTQLYNIRNVAFVKDKVFEVQGWDSLLPYQIGVRQGFKHAEEKTKGGSVTIVSNIKSLFEMLQLGRVDVVPLSGELGKAHIKKMDLKGIKALEPPIDKTKIYHFLHKSNQHLVAKVDKEMQKLHNEGGVERIFAKCFANPELCN